MEASWPTEVCSAPGILPVRIFSIAASSNERLRNIRRYISLATSGEMSMPGLLSSAHGSGLTFPGLTFLGSPAEGPAQGVVPVPDEPLGQARSGRQQVEAVDAARVDVQFGRHVGLLQPLGGPHVLVDEQV